MKTEKEVNNLRIAIGMTGIPMSNFVAELILETQKAMIIMGGDFDLKTASKISAAINKKYAPKKETK